MCLLSDVTTKVYDYRKLNPIYISDVCSDNIRNSRLYICVYICAISLIIRRGTLITGPTSGISCVIDFEVRRMKDYSSTQDIL
jgi:hypothetical protein